MAIKSSEEPFNKEALFKKLYDRFHKGDVLVTVATGRMSDAEADRTGLVSSHAYALLDIREVKVNKSTLTPIICAFEENCFVNDSIVGGSFVDAEESVVARTVEGQLFRAGR